MLRNNFLNFNHLNPFNISQNLVCVQSVRWRRKPRWLPTAPSKLFRVPERYVMPQNENIEWKRLNNNYRTQVNSIRRFLIHEVEERKKMIDLLATPADEEAEFQRCLAINEQWNQKIAEARVVRVEQENEKRREEILMNLEKKKVRDELIIRDVEERVKKEESVAQTFITRENIDKAIEIALANPSNYDFSIDLQGKRSDVIDKSGSEDGAMAQP